MNKFNSFLKSWIYFLKTLDFQSIGSEHYLARNQFPWILAIVLFVISYGGSFFYLDALYWDDWVLFDTAPEYLLETFEQAGTPWTACLHLLLLAVGPELYRISTFVLMFFSGYLLWEILQDFYFIESLERNIVALLFLVIPLNPARIALINFPATVAYFCFFCAWYLLIKRPGRKGLLFAIFLFLLSFSVPSILVFYVLPMIHVFYNDFWKNKSIVLHSKYLLLRKRLLLLSIPCAYFYVKTLYFSPSGVYEEYNSLSLEGLKSGFALACPIAMFFVMGLIFKVIFRNAFINRGILFLFWGFVIRWLAIFPYAAVGKSPSFHDWDSRFQLLMPLGGALIILGTFSWLSYGRVVRAIMLVLLLSSAINFYFSYEYYADWLKQETVIELISQADSIRNSRTILFNDQTLKFNARGRSYRFYEYNGWLKMAYGDETRFGVDLTDFNANSTDKTLSYYNPYHTGFYNAADYINGTPDVVVTINCDSSRIDAVLRDGQCFSLNVEEYEK